MERDLQVRHYWVIPVQPFQFTIVLKPCNWLVSSLESHLRYVKNVTDYCVEIYIDCTWLEEFSLGPKERTFLGSWLFLGPKENFIYQVQSIEIPTQ